MGTVRWGLLIATEVIFWGGLAAFFALRYWFNRPDLSRWVIGFVIVEHVALLVFGGVDFVLNRVWDAYQTIIVVILLYMLIWGKRDLARLDRWVGRRVARWRATRQRDSGH